MGGILRLLRQLFRGVVDVLLPPLCPLCRGISADGLFCPLCLARFHPLREPFCDLCGLPFAGVGASHPCPRCLEDPPAFASVRAWGRYEDGLLAAVRSFKYGGQIWQRRALEALFVQGFDTQGLAWAGNVEAVVPVPCTAAVLRRRGFDLPALLSRRLTVARGLPWRPRALSKTPGTLDLVGLGAFERRQATRAVYAPRERLSGTVLLVDDVVTTTATARACSQACLDAGARNVFVLALARTPLEVRGT